MSILQLPPGWLLLMLCMQVQPIHAYGAHRHTQVFLTASIVRPGQHHLRTEPHAESRRSCRPVVCGASDHVHTHVQRAAHRDEAQTPASQILLLLFITAFFILLTIRLQSGPFLYCAAVMQVLARVFWKYAVPAFSLRTSLVELLILLGAAPTSIAAAHVRGAQSLNLTMEESDVPNGFKEYRRCVRLSKRGDKLVESSYSIP